MIDHLSSALKELTRHATSELADAATRESIEAWRVRYLGRKGQLSLLLRQVKEAPPAQRRELGQSANQLKQALTFAYEATLIEVGEDSDDESSAQAVGVKAPLTALSGLPEPGHLHPLTLTLRKIQQIFSELGFHIYEGPLVDETYYSFDSLNMPPDHPARSEADSFYTTAGQVLRVQTSALQVRVVREQKILPPFQLMFPGRVFRNERTDATHETTFHQFEGLVIKKDVTIAQLKGVIEFFYSRFFGQHVQTRLRPSYFPFVEPGFEVDISCIFCGQSGCRICKYTGWLEVMGAGMVHPIVLTNMAIDANAWSGFAFGGAVDRLTMLQYGLPDIRLLWSGDLRILKQFS